MSWTTIRVTRVHVYCRFKMNLAMLLFWLQPVFFLGFKPLVLKRQKLTKFKPDIFSVQYAVVLTSVMNLGI